MLLTLQTDVICPKIFFLDILKVTDKKSKITPHAKFLSLKRCYTVRQAAQRYLIPYGLLKRIHQWQALSDAFFMLLLKHQGSYTKKTLKDQ